MLAVAVRGNLLARMLAPVAPTAFLQLSISVDDCGDFAEEVLENISCIKLIVTAATTTFGRDGHTGCPSRLSCTFRCTPDVKTKISRIAFFEIPLLQTPSPDRAAAMSVARRSTRAPSGHNGSPSCTNCIPPAFDTGSNCGDFAEEVLASTSCIELIVPAATTPFGCDGARAPLCDISCPSHLSCSSCCTRELKSGDSQSAMWPTPLTSTTCSKEVTPSTRVGPVKLQ